VRKIVEQKQCSSAECSPSPINNGGIMLAPALAVVALATFVASPYISHCEEWKKKARETDRLAKRVLDNCNEARNGYRQRHGSACHKLYARDRMAHIARCEDADTTNWNRYTGDQFELPGNSSIYVGGSVARNTCEQSTRLYQKVVKHRQRLENQQPWYCPTPHSYPKYNGKGYVRY
jgi:hypothetical protein